MKDYVILVMMFTPGMVIEVSLGVSTGSLQVLHLLPTVQKHESNLNGEF